MTLQNPDFYPWFYALLAPKSVYYFRASISALLLAQKMTSWFSKRIEFLSLFNHQKTKNNLLLPKISTSANSGTLCGSKLGYEYGKRGDLSIFKTSWFEFAMRRTTRPKKGVSSHFYLLLTVRPFRTEVLGAETAISEGSVVSLMCRTWGARPAAVITWFNGSRPFSEQPAGQVTLQVSLPCKNVKKSAQLLLKRTFTTN